MGTAADMRNGVLLVLSTCLMCGQGMPGSWDIGVPSAAGQATRDAGGRLRIVAAGENIWGRADSFHFEARPVRGDVDLSAIITWDTPGGHEHKKAGLMLRAGLAPDDPHASVMVHGDGLIALQYRREKGGPTEEVKAPWRARARIRLMRHGDVISMEVALGEGAFQPAASLTVRLPEMVYAGHAACSHDPNDRQIAVFSRMALTELGVAAEADRTLESTLETVNIETGQRRVIYRAREHFEAPNWTRDGKHLLINGGGRILRIPVEGGMPQHVPTGNVRVNNDHGLSFDGKWLIISGSVDRKPSQIFVLPADGGELRLVTPLAPSYWHGISPDGKTLVYCASRNNDYDIYSIPFEGGQETRLTDTPGLDDGPEYSPDGRWIYFNSVRSGLMRIWRMRPDGTSPQMVSQGPPSADWFAHPSPDGRWIAYLSYDASVEGHPANKDVTLRLAEPDGSNPRVLVTLFGGQGTINVPSWSPDSREFAFVSYRLVPRSAPQ